MSATLDKCLDDLESRIDESAEQANRQAWIDFLEDRCADDVFRPPSRQPNPPKIDWPTVTVNQAIRQPEAMLIQQFAACSNVLARGGAGRMCVRCNFGTGILPSLFGCGTFWMEERLNVLPTAVPFHSAEKMRQLVAAGPPDVRGGFGGAVFEMAERFLEILRARPKLGRHISLYHPDLQGPMDAAEVIWGSEMFYAFYDAPQLMTDLLAVITDTYIAFMRAWFELVGPPGEHGTHWGMMHKGVLMIRNDSLMNLSPETYVEFARPCDQRLFDEFGASGAMHFCGRGDHYIEAMSEMSGLTAVHMSQPHLNDLETIFRNTVDKRIKLIGLRPDHLKAAPGRCFHGQVQVYDTSEQLVPTHEKQ